MVRDSNATCQGYNIACADSVSLNQLFRIIRDQLALKDPRFAVALPQYDAFRPGDIRFSCASIHNARQMLSFEPTHGVEQGLAEALTWYLERARGNEAQPVGAPRSRGAAAHTSRAELESAPAAAAAL